RAECRRGARGITGVEERDTEVVVRDRISLIGLDGPAVALGGLLVRGSLVEGDAALIPQFRTVRALGNQTIVGRDASRDVLAQELQLRDGLLYERALLATLQCELVLAKRLRIVSLLPEREAKVEVRQRPPVGDR